MKFFLPIISFFLLTPAFCQLTYNSFDVGTENREYYQFIPSNYNSSENAPLVIILHGIGGFASDYANYGLNDLADTARFIPVYLQGKANAFGQNSWNNGTALINSTADDLAFISAIIDSIDVNYNIDRHRVYMVGISMGAIMTYKAIHHMSDKIAASVCHIGTMSDEEIANYNPTYPNPNMQVHGTLDAIVPYDGTPLLSLSLVPTTISKLKTSNGWNGTDSTIINIPDNVQDGITIERVIYETTTPLEHWKMTGAGHIFLFETINDTSGMVITWDFLRQFWHPNPTLSIGKDIPTNQPNIYPNPSSGLFNIEIDESTIKSLKIYNLNMQLVFESKPSQNIDINHLENGTYFLELIDNEGHKSIQKIIKV